MVAENSWRLDMPGGVGGLLLRSSGSDKYTYVTNHLGHVNAVYNQSGQKVESHQFSLYGTASGDEFSLQPFGFSTKRSNFASGLVYFGYRFYVPHLGRWLNRDPLQEEGGINLYAYVNGDPMGYVDPDGRFGTLLRIIPPALPSHSNSGRSSNNSFKNQAGFCANTGACQFNKRSPRKGKKSKESRPKNCPAGTKPIDNINHGPLEIYLP